jgi:hypothetical protein
MGQKILKILGIKFMNKSLQNSELKSSIVDLKKDKDNLSLIDKKLTKI